MNKPYQASLSRSQGRNSFSMIYRHPIRKSPDGKSGLRIRRGLGTSDEGEAQHLINEMNRLLQTPDLWSVSMRETASRQFDERIARAFYEDLLPPDRNPWDIRESVQPLPGLEQDYLRAYLLGTTGAGKSTLVRQLIGTHPKRERFPATSTGRTTVSDMEVITTDGPVFSAVVTFLTRDQTRQYIDECLFQALVAQVRDPKSPATAISEALLSHLRFRLRYILGDGRALAEGGVSGDFFDEVTEEDAEEDDAEISVDDRRKNASQISDFAGKIRLIAEDFRTSSAAALAYQPETLGDEEAFRELLEEELERNVRDENQYHSLIDEIADAVEARFGLLSQGSLERDSGEWPSHWTYMTDDRTQFIDTVKRFTSNVATYFGTLLTPLVEGIRVSGPFRPEWAAEENPRLVLLDGEGMGHTSDSVTSVPPKILRRYDLVDAVLLVDNATQPLQAVPFNILKSLASSGHDEKLVLCFTHLDEVRGPNIPTIEDKKAHVLAALDNVLKSIGETLHRGAENRLRKVTQDNVVFLAGLDKKLSPSNKPGTPANFAVGELRQLFAVLEMKRGKIPEPPEVFPEYDDASLALFVQQALREFHQQWRARLGRGSYPGLEATHWARIKALSRYVGVVGLEGYNNLQPLGDLTDGLRNHISRFLSQPSSWRPGPASADKQEAAIQTVLQKTSILLQSLAQRRLYAERKQDWITSYYLRGSGSTRVRASEVENIYRIAAPPIEDAVSPDAQAFLREVRAVVHAGIHAAGGNVSD